MSSNAVQRALRLSLWRALLLVGTGCLATSASHAAVSGEWAEGVSRDQSFARVLVVGISPEVNTRCRFERALAAKLKSANTAAIISCDVMDSSEVLTREAIEAAVAAHNADAVLATSLISREWDAKEGGGRDTRGAAYYKATDSFYGVYGTVVAADFRASAPLTTLEGAAHVTSKLYETRGATVVYTVDTKVRNIESRDEGIAAISEPIAKRLRRDGLIK